MVRGLLRRGYALIGVVGVAALLAAVPAGSVGAAAPTAPSGSHCVANVTGQLPSGQFTLSPARCFGSLSEARMNGQSYSSGTALTSSILGTTPQLSPATMVDNVWLATHFDGFTLTGNSFSVFGASCSANGWINVGPVWNNKISSTESACASWHFDGTNLTGAYEMITAPGGDLSALNNRTGSVQYTS
jgi:hypothetical protein